MGNPETALKILLLLLFLFLPFCAFAQDEDDDDPEKDWGEPSPETLQAAREILAKKQRNEFAGLDQLVKLVLPKDAEWHFRGNPAELEFLLRNPQSLYAIRNVACSALSLSISTCEVHLGKGLTARINEEETDAVRHFMFGAGIACIARGPEFAQVYTTLHEGPVEQWDRSNEMDFKNNLTGIEWSKGKCGTPWFGSEIKAKHSVQMLRDKKLVTLKKGNSSCTRPEELLQKGFAGIHEQQRNVVEYFQTVGYKCK